MATRCYQKTQSELREAWCGFKHQYVCTSCMEISNNNLSPFRRIILLQQHYSVFTAQCNRRADKPQQYKVQIFHSRAFNEAPIRTMKERNHSLIVQLTEMKGTLSSKSGNWFLQGTGESSREPSWENGCLNDRPKTLSQEFIEKGCCRNAEFFSLSVYCTCFCSG